ncbi:class II fructose-bisphosphate aldolase [Phycicoccus sp. BSK3Z-2]|uniref:Class II fructose-bisphosphate aldolase n=1 Tax=Phycicoccus avicenniae TaxID=2828860 RepID=A0A941D4N3_9MICO|nr:class II fructose-bisphosphate aldolase [Phycicoccus avicenniae]MBR7741820.1 class II fructose-bisphosphate aldolase [Phycicoccus avicenniae]
MLASTVQLTRAARDQGYAVPAVNVFDEVSMRAVVEAAQVAAAPLIVQVSVKTLRSLGTPLVGATFEAVTKDATVPIALHLDHCPDRAVISMVIAAGWSSVLFDASDRDMDDALRETTEVVSQAHAVGVDVESEIENILGVEDGVGSAEARHAYTVEELAKAAEATGADLLAPQLGTSHGAFKTPPKLLPGRVRDLAALVDRPIVLHGGTGLIAEDFQSFIQAGVSKINISTAVKHAYMQSAAQHLDTASRRDKWDPPSLFQDITVAIRVEITDLIEQFGAAGRAHTATR